MAAQVHCSASKSAISASRLPLHMSKDARNATGRRRRQQRTHFARFSCTASARAPTMKGDSKLPDRSRRSRCIRPCSPSRSMPACWSVRPLPESESAFTFAARFACSGRVKSRTSAAICTGCQRLESQGAPQQLLQTLSLLLQITLEHTDAVPQCIAPTACFAGYSSMPGCCSGSSACMRGCMGSEAP
jgi:hypothetical protein